MAKSIHPGIRAGLAFVLAVHLVFWTLPLIFAAPDLARLLGVYQPMPATVFWARMLGAVFLALCLGLWRAIRRPEENLAAVRTALCADTFTTAVLAYYAVTHVLRSPWGWMALALFALMALTLLIVASAIPHPSGSALSQ